MNEARPILKTKRKNTKNENMQNVPCARKHAACAKRGKTYNLDNALENMEPVPSAGKQQPVLSARKLAVCDKRGKTSNLQPYARKHETCAKYGKRY